MGEWRSGWRVVLGAALAAATGVNLLYYVFSIFIPPLQKETGWTLGQFSQLQALVGLGSLAAPAVGWAMDRWGFRRVYATGMALLTLLFLFIGTMPFVPALFGLLTFITGLIGVLTTSISYTRAVAGWFVRNRGLALALAATGISLSAVIMPPLFEAVIGNQGWRAGYFLLAALSGLIGLPAILLLLREEPARMARAAAQTAEGEPDHAFFRTSAFWLIIGSFMCFNLPGSGILSQMVPMMMEEGVSAKLAALGISAFAVGQVLGRLGCGALLDRANPSRVAFIFTLVPAFGCLALWGTNDTPWITLLAVGVVGIQQGAETDLLGYYIARKFGLDRYGMIFGWVQAAGWASTISGILLFGRVHDLTGSYAHFQLMGVFAYAAGAVMIGLVRLPRLTAHH